MLQRLQLRGAANCGTAGGGAGITAKKKGRRTNKEKEAIIAAAAANHPLQSALAAGGVLEDGRIKLIAADGSVRFQDVPPFDPAAALAAAGAAPTLHQEEALER